LGRIPLFVPQGSIIPVGPVLQYTAEKSTEPTTLYIFGGKDASFTLYEDEGINYNYKAGKFSKIQIDYSASGNTLTIRKRVGAFDGMDSEKKFRIVWVDAANPQVFAPELVNSDVFAYTGSELIIHKK
ncbi:MAG: hypothetical protein RIS47_1664, partial [Bacteroidota bacterium]